jgi:phosphoribosylformylglycinamidine synthase
LTNNDNGRFIDRWVYVAARSTKCIWTAGLAPLELPIAHGEGKFVPANDAVRRGLQESDQIALIYTDRDGSPAAGRWPDNPNGSSDDIAGVCDATGLVFGLMPHPERHLNAMQHPGWTSRGIDVNAEGPGLQIFRNAYRYITEAVGTGI